MSEDKANIVPSAITFVLCGLLLVLLVMFSGIPVNHDAALFLQCAQLLLEGKIPYVDYVDLNLPLIHYLHVLPVAIARIFSFDIATTFQCIVVLMSLASAVLLFIILQRSSAVRTVEGRLLFTAGWIVFSVCAAISNTFGQREHLFLLAFIPWLYCREARYRSVEIPRWISWIAGSWLGLLLLVKPHFLIYSAACEFWMLYRMRKTSALRSTEIFVPMGICSLYLMHFLFVPPTMSNALFGRWLPFIIKHYHVYDSSLTRVLFLDSLTRAIVPVSVILGLISALLLSRHTSPKSRFQIEILMIATMAGCCLHVWSMKSWWYHLLLGVGPLLLLLTMMVLIAFEDELLHSKTSLLRKLRIHRMLILSVSQLIIFILIAGVGWYRIRSMTSTMREDIMPFIHILRQETEINDAVTFISTNVFPAYPALVYADRLPGTRFLCAFPIAMLYDGVDSTTTVHLYRSLNAQSNGEEIFLNELGDDIRRSMPKIVLIDTSDGQGCPRGFHVNEYLRFTGWDDRFLTRYKFVSNIKNFEMYRRKESTD